MRHAYVYSLNTAEEIEILKDKYIGVEFIQTDRTVKEYFGKDLVSINALIDFAKEKNEDLLLINSDIFIENLPPLLKDGVTIFSRYDYEDDIENAQMFIYGFDLFHIPKQFLSIFPPVIYGLGNCWYDLGLPYRAIFKKIPVYYPQGKFIYHKKHLIQYNHLEWERTYDFFNWEFNIDKNMKAPQAATLVMKVIKNKAIIY